MFPKGVSIEMFAFLGVLGGLALAALMYGGTVYVKLFPLLQVMAQQGAK